MIYIYIYIVYAKLGQTSCGRSFAPVLPTIHMPLVPSIV